MLGQWTTPPQTMQSQPMRKQTHYMCMSPTSMWPQREHWDPVETWTWRLYSNTAHHPKQGKKQSCRRKGERCGIQIRLQLWEHIHWRDMQNPGGTTQGTRESSQNTTKQQWCCSSHKPNRPWHPVEQCTGPRTWPHVVEKEIQRSTLDPSQEHHHEPRPEPGSSTQIYLDHTN